MDIGAKHVPADEYGVRIAELDEMGYRRSFWTHLFFDEIQEVEGWEKCVNSLRVALDCDIYITGSNAN